MENLKKTVLRQRHIDAGATMVPFGGWDMPVQYRAGIIAEHNHTRKSVSIFDICHMGEFRIRGKNSAEALDRLLARPVADQKTGTCRYNFLLTERATIIDDLIVYRMAEDEFFIVVNAATTSTDADVFRKALPDSVCFSDESEITGKIDLQGPLSADALEKLGLAKKNLPAYYNWTRTSIRGLDCLLSRTGYTGELGFEIYAGIKETVELWDMLALIPDVKAAGLGSRDSLRLEMAYPLYGHELNTETTPVEAGFEKILKLDVPRTFTGCEILRDSQPRKKLVGIEMEGRRTAREGYSLKYGDRMAGRISSGGFSPSLGRGIALAYIDSGVPETPGTEFEIIVERGSLKGKITGLPFYKSGTARMKICLDKLFH